MAVSRALARLLHLREIEEEQRRLALESAQMELHRLGMALAAASERERKGRALVTASARSGQFEERFAGLEETRASKRHAAALVPRIAASEERVGDRREAYLEKRVERRQVETLIAESEAQAEVEAGRRGQQSLDGWYSARKHREGVVAERTAGRAARLGSGAANRSSEESELL
jgi:flagellar biosynthesis chaperone FliJ